MGNKLSAQVLAHLHKDEDVTPRRLTAFAMESRSTQLKVLAELRARAVEDTVELPVLAILLAIVVPLVVLFQDAPDTGGPWWARLVAISIVVVVFAFVMALVLGVGPIWRHVKRVRASVWLPAFDDELRRRHAMKGRLARAWQREH